ncbi:MAG: helix-turn-helix domain-containing protein [Pseudomonadota bacterium]
MTESSNFDTRAALVRAAERLIAERGFGTVSVKDITREAGARNPSAVHYHFGSVDGLVKEVFAQRFAAIEIERMKRFDELFGASPEVTVYELLYAALAPLFDTCLEKEGRLYVRFTVQFASDPRFELEELVDRTSMESLQTMGAKLAQLLPQLPAAILTLRFRQGFNFSLIQAADYATCIENDQAPSHERALHEAALSLTGFFSAPAR